MFRASSAHLQEDTVVHMQHMVLSLSMRVPGVLSVHSVSWAVYRQATRNSHSEWQYHMLHVHNCVLLKMSAWGSKHVEENIILWINNNQCIKMVINIQSFEISLFSQFVCVCVCNHQFNFWTRWPICIKLGFNTMTLVEIRKPSFKHSCIP